MTFSELLASLTAAGARARAAAWAYLRSRRLYVFAALLLVLAASVLLTGIKSQQAKTSAVAAVVEVQQSKQQARELKKTLARATDSIQTQVVVIRRIVHVRDSAVRVARKLEVKADSLIKTTDNEALSAAPGPAAARLQNFLSGYRPGAYPLRPGGTDTLR